MKDYIVMEYNSIEDLIVRIKSHGDSYIQYNHLINSSNDYFETLRAYTDYKENASCRYNSAMIDLKMAINVIRDLYNNEISLVDSTDLKEYFINKYSDIMNRVDEIEREVLHRLHIVMNSSGELQYVE